MAVNRRASLSLLLRYLLFVLFNKNSTVIEIMTITSTAIKKYHKSLAVAVDIKVLSIFLFWLINSFNLFVYLCKNAHHKFHINNLYVQKVKIFCFPLQIAVSSLPKWAARKVIFLNVPAPLKTPPLFTHQGWKDDNRVDSSFICTTCDMFVLQ